MHRAGMKPLTDNNSFPQYALMALLWQRSALRSITWFKLANISKTARRRHLLDARHERIASVMGSDLFGRLQRRIVKEELGSSGLEGEPDLFCWSEKTGDWFFAEAKWGRDRVREKQRRWIRACREVLPDADIRLYTLVASEESVGV
jgi:hypothetical protein